MLRNTCCTDNLNPCHSVCQQKVPAKFLEEPRRDLDQALLGVVTSKGNAPMAGLKKDIAVRFTGQVVPFLTVTVFIIMSW